MEINNMDARQMLKVWPPIVVAFTTKHGVLLDENGSTIHPSQTVPHVYVLDASGTHPRRLQDVEADFAAPCIWRVGETRKGITIANGARKYLANRAITTPSAVCPSESVQNFRLEWRSGKWHCLYLCIDALATQVLFVAQVPTGGWVAFDCNRTDGMRICANATTEELIDAVKEWHLATIPSVPLPVFPGRQP